MMVRSVKRCAELVAAMLVRRSFLLATFGVSVAMLGWAPETLASSMRYTLSATYTQENDYKLDTEVCNWVDPPHAPYGTPQIFVCSVDVRESHTSSSYTAHSVHPFPLRVYFGQSIQGTARMAGSFSQVTDGSVWARWWLGGIGFHACTASSGGSAHGSVAGEITLSGRRLVVDVGSGGGRFGTQTTVLQCASEAPTTSTEPFGGIARAEQLLKPSGKAVFGRAFTLTERVVGGYPWDRVTMRWTFRFTPVKEPPKAERWQIEVRGRDRWSWGEFTGLRAGVGVDWVHRSTLEVKDGKVTSATGKVDVLDVTPFSEPPGAFTVTSHTSTPPAYRLAKAIKRGDSVELNLRKESGSRYRVDFSVRVAGPQVLDQLRKIGVPDPDYAYQTMVARGPINDTVVDLVPYNGRLVVPLRPGVFTRETGWFDDQLACHGTQQDCFLVRGGEIITVTRLS